MKHWSSVIAASLGALGLFAAACSSSKGASHPGEQPDTGDDAGGSTAPAADGGSDASDDEPAPAPQAFVRIAQLSPDLPPADVCIAPHGTTDFQGPLIGQLARSLAGGDGGAEDASLPGLSYPQVSAYLAVTPGQYDVRLVGAGATDCSADPSADAASDAGADAASGSPPDTTNLPALAYGTSSTLLIAGDFSPVGADRALTVAMLPDDAVLAGGAAVLRAINAVPSWPSLDLGYGSPAGTWSPVLANVVFAQASSQAAPGYGTVDGNGYLAIAPIAGKPVGTWPSDSDAASDPAHASSVEIDLGSIASVIAVGGKTGDGANPPSLLVCMDNQPSGGLLSDCSVAP
jgi:hypothetical protein